MEFMSCDAFESHILYIKNGFNRKTVYFPSKGKERDKHAGDQIVTYLQVN